MEVYTEAAVDLWVIEASKPVQIAAHSLHYGLN